MVRDWRNRFAAGLLVLTGFTTAVMAQQNCRPDKSIAPHDALRLAVKLKTYSEGSFRQYAAGIVIGDRAGTLYIATAEHVVMDGDSLVDSVQAFFYDHCDKQVRASVCSVIDAKRDLDLAFLCVPLTAVPGARPPSLSRRGNVSHLSARTPVYPVGCPTGKDCWIVGQPDKVLVAGENQPRILFTTFFVAPGHSGGPLFNEWWEVVGMLTKHGQPLSEAIPIDSVLNAACDSICRKRSEQNTLEAPFVPRSGYRLSLGYNALVSGADGEPDGRRSPQRINLLYRLNPLVEFHGGSLRLTPENLSVTSAMFGIGLNYPTKGRVWFNPFLEGGFGHVEGRFKASSYFIDDNGSNVEVPVWQQVEDDALGYGAGASLMGLVAPHTIVEVMWGHWSFNRPEGAPAMPASVWGVGLRFGI